MLPHPLICPKHVMLPLEFPVQSSTLPYISRVCTQRQLSPKAWERSYQLWNALPQPLSHPWHQCCQALVGSVHSSGSFYTLAALLSEAGEDTGSRNEVALHALHVIGHLSFTFYNKVVNTTLWLRSLACVHLVLEQLQQVICNGAEVTLSALA